MGLLAIPYNRIPGMTPPRTVSEMPTDHVVFEVELERGLGAGAVGLAGRWPWRPT